MINGHGDDIHNYDGITMNFSSNIYAHADLQPLLEHLRSRLALIANYPEPEPRSLERKLASKLGVPDDCVVVTNGATDAIYIVAEMLCMKGIGKQRIMKPTFAEYEDACLAAGVRLDDSADVVWLCNPNNPTGSALESGELKRMAAMERVMVVDQSYGLFTDVEELSAEDVVAMGNVIQIHSMTKSCAIPGLRLGYVVAAREWTEELRKRMRPWSVNALAIEAGHFIVDNDFRAVKDVRAYLEETQRLRGKLNEIEGITVEPTRTNFMLCRLQRGTAAELKQRLATKYGMLIRDASNFSGLTPQHFRVAAQSREENNALVEAIKCLMRSAAATGSVGEIKKHEL
ncbi:MAG: aminotransferase class I/II-fold pyridoxal phosphate-dependent enzyme [Prevotella sp.]